MSSVYIRESIYRKSFLLDEEDDRTNFVIWRGGRRVDYDEFDFQILKLIAGNARMPTTEIARRLNSNALTINNRIKKLIELMVILGFTVEIDFDKLGYQWFKVDLYLKEYNKNYQIIKYLEANPQINVQPIVGIVSEKD